EEQVRATEASEERLKTMTGYTRIVAPFAGVITKRYADPGAMIQQGTASSSQATPVVRVSDVSKLRLVLDVPETAVPRIRTGSAVQIKVDALNRVIEGRVARFSGRLQQSTRTMETEIDVLNPSGEMKPGMFATALITLDRRDGALAIPVQAISNVAGQPH